MLKKLSVVLGLVCAASLGGAAKLHAGARRPNLPPADVTVSMRKRDAGYGGTNTIGDPTFPGASGDSVPYHLTGEVSYQRRASGLAVREIHIHGWLDSTGHPPYVCGKFQINAKHVWINGRDYSGSLRPEAGLTAGSSNWGLVFVGPLFPIFPAGTTVSIRAYVSYSGNCIPIGNSSADTGAVIQ